MVKRLNVFLLVFSLVWVLAACNGSSNLLTAEYPARSDAVSNPLMGYATWFSDIDELPEDTQLVYVPILWSEWEPREGVFAWNTLETQYCLSDLRAMGYHLVIRFICDYPDEDAHRDIPQWLYNKTSDGVDYDIDYGTGYCPNYDNPVFIRAHANAVAALGQYLGDDSFVSYIELGSLGHWGEWHTKFSDGLPRIPTEEIREQYVTPWIDAFPNAKILMRRPFSHAQRYGFGIYNDMAGSEKATREWLDWIANGGSYSQTGEEHAVVPMPDTWKSAPIGGEFTSSIPMKSMLEEHLDQTVSLLRESHTTFLGPKDASPDFPEGRAEVLKNIGYRLRISKAELCRTDGETHLTLRWENDGVAPMYWDWPVQIYLEDADGNTLQTYPMDLKLTSVLPGISVDASVTINEPSLFSRLESDQIQITVGIVDPMTGKDALTLCMDTAQNNGRTILLQ